MPLPAGVVGQRTREVLVWSTFEMNSIMAFLDGPSFHEASGAAALRFRVRAVFIFVSSKLK